MLDLESVAERAMIQQLRTGKLTPAEVVEITTSAYAVRESPGAPPWAPGEGLLSHCVEHILIVYREMLQTPEFAKLSERAPEVFRTLMSNFLRFSCVDRDVARSTVRRKELPLRRLANDGPSVAWEDDP